MGKLSIENYLNLSSERGIWFEEIVFTDELCSALYSFYGQPRCCLNLFLFFSG